MKAERFRQLLDSYGGDASRWPASLRGEMLEFVDAHPEARNWLHEARHMDLLLDSYQPSTADLTERIMGALPRSFVDRVLEWLLPALPSQWWRPALAGAMPLVLGVAIGLSELSVVGADSVDWELQEQLLLVAPAGDWYE